MNATEWIHELERLSGEVVESYKKLTSHLESLTTIAAQGDIVLNEIKDSMLLTLTGMNEKIYGPLH